MTNLFTIASLQHGGIAFLYHPCAENSSISRLRYIADSCMHRYVLTQYHKLSPEKVIEIFDTLHLILFPTLQAHVEFVCHSRHCSIAIHISRIL